MKKIKVKRRKAGKPEEDTDTPQPVEGEKASVPADAGKGPAGTAPSDVSDDSVARDESKPAAAAEVAEPVDPVERLEAKVASLEDSLLRAKADYQNLQRRIALDRAEAISYANAELMKSLLGVIDDFERSLEAAETSGNLEAVVDGVRLVYENLIKALGMHGLERIVALHRPFDPNFHEAMMQQPSADCAPGSVMEEIARGYRLRDRVLRPAKVVVSKVPEDKQAATSGQSQEELEEEN
jgi:molecular chaperone GrpE